MAPAGSCTVHSLKCVGRHRVDIYTTSGNVANEKSEIKKNILERTHLYEPIEKNEATLHNALRVPEACGRHGVSLVYPQVDQLDVYYVACNEQRCCRASRTTTVLQIWSHTTAHYH